MFAFRNYISGIESKRKTRVERYNKKPSRFNAVDEGNERKYMGTTLSVNSLYTGKYLRIRYSKRLMGVFF